jgi:hypothetical protein
MAEREFFPEILALSEENKKNILVAGPGTGWCRIQMQSIYSERCSFIQLSFMENETWKNYVTDYNN